VTGRWIADGPPKPHECRQPWMLGRKTGSVWQCECGKAWKIWQTDSWGDYYRVWKLLSADELKCIPRRR
jgi:hypothetical protein